MLHLIYSVKTKSYHLTHKFRNVAAKIRSWSMSIGKEFTTSATLAKVVLFYLGWIFWIVMELAWCMLLSAFRACLEIFNECIRLISYKFGRQIYFCASWIEENKTKRPEDLKLTFSLNEHNWFPVYFLHWKQTSQRFYVKEWIDLAQYSSFLRVFHDQ